MRLASTLKIAFRALRRNKMRSTLTALGMIIGVGAVIAMTGVGNGAKSQVESQIASLGKNVILVFSGGIGPNGIRMGWGGTGTLKISDAEAIEREIPNVTIVSPEIRTSAQVVAGNQNWLTQVLGESADYFDLRQWPLEDGTSFTPQDVRSAAKVAVIGKTVAKYLYGSESPLGQIIRIKNVPFVILGVLSAKGLSIMGSDQDDVVVLPYTSAMKRIAGVTTLRGINIQVASGPDMAPAQQQIIGLLRQQHGIWSGKEEDFTVRSQEEIAAMATATSKIMSLLLGSIASVSLLVGGIGIMNIMLVSVTERTREIGIRMAVGAHGRDILLQFLIEAVALSSLGGLIGILLGLGSSRLIAALAGWPVAISASSVALAFLFSAAVGIFFGFYPAKKASQLDPIDALRYE
ncbi:MAG: ABC transporter permease [Verrucomicrobia bacterium]|nr:ABC transporter permease [Verrucomicrobiota bacterium]